RGGGYIIATQSASKGMLSAHEELSHARCHCPFLQKRPHANTRVELQTQSGYPINSHHTDTTRTIARLLGLVRSRPFWRARQHFLDLCGESLEFERLGHEIHALRQEFRANRSVRSIAGEKQHAQTRTVMPGDVCKLSSI